MLTSYTPKSGFRTKGIECLCGKYILFCSITALKKSGLLSACYLHVQNAEEELTEQIEALKVLSYT